MQEYKVIETSTAEDLEAEMNEAGADMWELKSLQVAFTPNSQTVSPAPRRYIAVMERAKAGRVTRGGS